MTQRLAPSGSWVSGDQRGEQPPTYSALTCLDTDDRLCRLRCRPNDAPGAAVETVDDGLRVVEVEMTEMAFGPASIDIASGETLRLRFYNAGLAVHEAVIGDLAFQEDHAAGMAGGATHEADDAHEEGTDQREALVVAPGDSADMVYTAEEAGALIIGCHRPGHWDAGMRSDLNVS